MYQEIKEDDLEVVVNNVARTKDGKKLFSHLLAISGVDEPVYCGDSKDLVRSIKSDFGLVIKKMLLEYAFDVYTEILRKGIENE